MSGNPSAPPPIRPGGGGGPDSVNCDLRFRTQLASPVAAVVAGLVAGGDLVIDLEDSGGVQVIVAKTTAGAIAGSIVDNVGQLIRCIQQGNTYAATIDAVAGGAVTIDVARS